MQYIGAEPIPQAVTVEDFKRAVHIVDEDVEDDAAFGPLLLAAQDVVTVATGRPLSLLEYEFIIPVANWRRWWFPCAPVKEITSVDVTDANGDWVAQDLTKIRLVRGYDEPQLLVPAGWAGFVNGADLVRVRAKVGYETPDPGVVAPSHQAIILLVKEWFEAGIAIDEPTAPARLTMGALRLIKQRRYRRPVECSEG